jgi:KaiC/GvpD/RAD55 family RecA-like ATPase
VIHVDDLLRSLHGVKRAGKGWTAQCPAHDDKRASLSISEGTDGRILLHCHAGCELADILEALRLDVKELFPDDPKGKGEILATYDYTDEAGKLLFQVVRFFPKDFRQRRPVGDDWEWSLGDTPRVLYHLPTVRKAVEAGRRVFVVEGEKDVHTLEALGLVATCNAGGAGKWPHECSDGLRGAHVVILPDNDEAGKQHAELVTGALAGIAADATVLNLPGLTAKGDVTDWVRNGGTADELKQLVLRPPLPDGVVNLVEAVRSVAVYAETPMPRGIDYPWPVVNKLTRGMRPGWITFLAGYPGTGKTAAAIEAMIAAARQEHSVLMASLEMSRDETAIRVAQRFGLDTGRLYGGHPEHNDRYAFELAAGMPYHSNVNLVYQRRLLSEIEELVAALRPDLLIVDYLQLLDIGTLSRTEGTTRNAYGLKYLAQKYECAVLCLSQLSRPQERLKAYVPGIFDLRDSGAIENAADQIIFVYRERDESNKTAKDEGAFIVAKVRMGKTGMESFVFDGAAQTFEMQSAAEERAAAQGWSVYQGAGARD